jgi:hypothetical protein
LSITLTIWRAHLKSLRNASRHDTQMRLALGVVLVFNIIAVLWSANQLSARLHQWQAIGSPAMDAGLWSLCWLTWSGMSFFAALGSIRLAFSGDEAQLLVVLPIASASRFRTLYGLFFVENLWNWLLLEVGVTSYVLVSSLGWHALPWLVLLQLGIGVVVLCTLVVTLWVIRYLIPRERVKTRIWVTMGTAIALLLLLAFKGSVNPNALLIWFRPEYVIPLFALLLAIALGPFANPLGRLYMAAFQTTQNWDRSRKPLTVPGLHVLTSTFTRYRTLTGALWVKSLLSQVRNVFFWLRLAMIVIGIALFPLVYTAIAHYGFSAVTLVAAYAAGLSLLHVIEVAPNAISGEGNRLALYLTAPLELPRILRAKLIPFLLPVLSESIVIGLLLSWQRALALNQVAFALVAIVLMVLGNVTLLVLGSAWDEDLNLAIEGTLQAILQEEMPVSPRKMGLFNLSVLLFALMFLLLWKVPALLALVGLVVLNAIILVGVWKFSQAQLHRRIQDAS